MLSKVKGFFRIGDGTAAYGVEIEYVRWIELVVDDSFPTSQARDKWRHVWCCIQLVVQDGPKGQRPPSYCLHARALLIGIRRLYRRPDGAFLPRRKPLLPRGETPSPR